ncbi:MAG: fibronectin type III domain-containing protein [Pseudomonadota bacterium]
MNNLLHTGITVAATFLTCGIFFGSAAYAVSEHRPADNCMPSCEAIDLEQSVNLSWTAPTTRTDGELLSLSDLEGYRIYYGTEEANLIPLVDLDDSATTSYSVNELSPGFYYFTVTAYDYDGLESGFSEVVSKEIL